MLAYVVSEATRNTFRYHKFQNFPGGAPPDPPIGVVIKIPTPTNPKNTIRSLPTLNLTIAMFAPLDGNPG